MKTSYPECKENQAERTQKAGSTATPANSADKRHIAANHGENIRSDPNVKRKMAFDDDALNVLPKDRFFVGFVSSAESVKIAAELTALSFSQDQGVPSQ